MSPRGRRNEFDTETTELAMRAGLARGLSDTKVGTYAHVSARTVLRFRQRKNIPANIPRMGNHPEREAPTPVTVTILPSTGRRPARVVKDEFNQIKRDAVSNDWDHLRNCFNKPTEFTDYEIPPTQKEARRMCGDRTDYSSDPDAPKRCPMLDICKEAALVIKPGWGVLGGISWINENGKGRQAFEWGAETVEAA